MPTVADSNNGIPMVQNYYAGQEVPQTAVTGSIRTSSVPIAPSPSALPVPTPSTLQAQQLNAVAKRRRVDAPGGPAVALAGGAVTPAYASEQLAAAAAQAMQSQGRGRKKSQAQIDRR